MSAPATELYFWASKSPFSNFYECDFPLTVQSDSDTEPVTHTFASSEHAFMYCKALFFGDAAAANLIRVCRSPQTAKRLGRKVKWFNEQQWSLVREEIMYMCLLAKFSHCNDAWSVMDEARGRTFVEASPHDRIWGIGFRAREAPRKRALWGQNLLGKTLNRVIAELHRTGREGRSDVVRLHEIWTRKSIAVASYHVRAKS